MSAPQTAQANDIGMVSLFAELEAIAAANGWMSAGVCTQTDAEAFFPIKGSSPRQAKKICAGCEVRNQCLQYALDNDIQFGVWGGLTAAERQHLH